MISNEGRRAVYENGRQTRQNMDWCEEYIVQQRIDRC